MKNYIKVFIISMSLFLKGYSQGVEQEAIAVYQLAQEEFDKNNVSQAINYLNKAEKIDIKSKIKTSYLKAKCYEKIIFDSYSIQDSSLIINCLSSIKYYLDNGKDDLKINELFKLKYKLENYKQANEMATMFKKQVTIMESELKAKQEDFDTNSPNMINVVRQSKEKELSDLNKNLSNFKLLAQKEYENKFGNTPPLIFDK